SHLSWLAAISMLRSKGPDLSEFVAWGWKEPNTHIFIEYLAQYYHQRIKYIHVVRHGLDMAYSRNQKQLHNWGHLFGVQIPPSPQLLPKASLNYWIKANEKAIASGKLHLGDRFLLVNFDELCSARDREVKRLAEFAGMRDVNVNMKELYSIPRRPSSTGRYKQHELSIFDQGEIDAVRRLGFELDG
ncbi:MAG: sulfotransferase, partial [Methanomassiliicoccales archaeon]